MLKNLHFSYFILNIVAFGKKNIFFIAVLNVE